MYRDLDSDTAGCTSVMGNLSRTSVPENSFIPFYSGNAMTAYPSHVGVFMVAIIRALNERFWAAAQVVQC